MGSVKVHEGVRPAFKEDSCRSCGSNYEDETHNNNQVVADSDSETTPDASSGSWDEHWVPPKKPFHIAPPGVPSYIAKDANSLTFQWDGVIGDDDGEVVYEVEMQLVDVLPGSTTPDLGVARTLVDEEEWSVVYCGKECWTQVKALHPGRYYAVRIRCIVNEASVSDYSDVVVFHTTPTVPCVPQPPELMGLEHDSMTFKWRAPWEHGGSDITGYRLQLCPPPGPYPKRQEFEDVYVGPELATKVLNLRPFVKYTARVKAINEVGEGPWSLYSCFKTKPHVPEIPRHLSATATTPCCVQLDWSSDWQNGRDRDLYEIEIANVEDRFCQYEYSGHETRHEVAGLECGQEYQFRVRAENELGTGDWSRPVTLCLAPCPPSPPSRPFLTSSTQKGVSCAWYPPQLLGGKSQIKYQVEMISVSPTILEGCMQAWQVVYEGYKRDCFVKDLVSGCEYCMRVKAMNEAGWGLPSLSLQFQASPGIPHKPFVPHAVERYDRSMRIFWICPAHDGGKEIDNYRMQICPANQLSNIEDAEPFEDVYEGPRNSMNLTDLIPGTVYAIRVCAVNEIGSSEWSDIGYESTPPGPPLAPQNLRLVHLEATSLQLTWDRPEGDGGSTITSYHVAVAKNVQVLGDHQFQGSVQALSDGQLEFQEVYSDVLPECSIDGLDSRTSYMVKARAVNEHGDSDWSSILMVETKVNVPRALTGLEVQETNDTTVQLTWHAPEPTGNEDVTISVEMARNDGVWVEQYRGKKTECSIGGLTAGEEVTFRIRGENANGSGPYSKSLSVVMPSRQPSIPDAPSVTQITSSTIRIKWMAPASNGKPILSYKVEVEGEDGALFETDVPASNTFLRLADLSATTAYQLRLAALNEMGSSEWSMPVRATTKAAPPLPPQDLRASIICIPAVKVDVFWSMADLCKECVFDVEAFVAGSKKAKSLQTVVHKATVSSMFCTLSLFERGQKYEIRVRATSAGVSGKWSTPLLIRIPEEPSTPIPTKPECESSVPPIEETEASTPRRIKRGQVIVPARSKNPLKKRKSVWKTFKSHVPVPVFCMTVASLVFLMLFLLQ